MIILTVLSVIPIAAIVLLLVLGSILLWWSYLHKRPVLIIATFVIGALLLQGLTLYQFYRVNNLFIESNDRRRQEAFHELLGDLPAASILTWIRSGEVREVTVDYNHPAELFFHLDNNLHVLTITREGPPKAPKTVVQIKSTTSTLTNITQELNSFPLAGNAMVLGNDSWTCMVIPSPQYHDKSHFQLFVFDKPQTRDYTTAAMENPELLKENPNLFFQLDITIQP